jgi:hypothetical protein
MSKYLYMYPGGVSSVVLDAGMMERGKDMGAVTFYRSM